MLGFSRNNVTNVHANVLEKWEKGKVRLCGRKRVECSEVVIKLWGLNA